MRFWKNWRGRAAGHGGCECCGDSWGWKEAHVTSYSETEGCFPLCEECWVRLGTPEAREPYYWSLISKWNIQGFGYIDPDKQLAKNDAVLEAVRAGG